MAAAVEEQRVKMKEDLVPVDSVGDGDSLGVISEVDEKRLLRRIDLW